MNRKKFWEDLREYTIQGLEQYAARQEARYQRDVDRIVTHMEKRYKRKLTSEEIKEVNSYVRERTRV